MTTDGVHRAPSTEKKAKICLDRTLSLCYTMYMKNNQITMFDTPCVLYVRENKKILKEGSWAFLDSIRALTQLSKFKVNIVSKKFYENVLTGQ